MFDIESNTVTKGKLRRRRRGVNTAAVKGVPNGVTDVDAAVGVDPCAAAGRSAPGLLPERCACHRYSPR